MKEFNENKTMKANVYDFLLNLYKNDDELRPAMNEPSLCLGTACATDAHAIILINPGKCGMTYTPVPNYPNVQAAIPKVGKSSKIKLPDLISEIARYSVSYPECQPTQKCNECDGTGESECSACSHVHDCDECDGKGYLTVEHQTLQKGVDRNKDGHFNIMRIGKRNMNMRYALLLADTCAYLGVQEAELLNSDADMPVGFYFKITDDVRVVIMPVTD